MRIINVMSIFDNSMTIRGNDGHRVYFETCPTWNLAGRAPALYLVVHLNNETGEIFFSKEYRNKKAAVRKFNLICSTLEHYYKKKFEEMGV